MSWSRALLLCVLAVNLSACGIKRPLKSPSQIEQEAQKKAQKEEAKKAKEAGARAAQPEPTE